MNDLFVSIYHAHKNEYKIITSVYRTTYYIKYVWCDFEYHKIRLNNKMYADVG